MANLCNNTFQAYTEDSANVEVIKNFFDNWSGSDYEESDNQIDVYFDSNWDFPKKEMDNLFELIPNKANIYMRCLSVEYGNLYHALWVCDEDGWREV